MNRFLVISLVLAIAVLVTLLCPNRASAAQNGPDKSPTLQVPLTDAKPTIPRFDSIVDLFRADDALKAEDVPFVRGEQSVKPCAFFPGKQMRQITLTFTSPVYRGRTSEHAAVVFLPEGEIPQHAQGGAPVQEASDGLSMVPTLLGQPGGQEQHEFLYWEFKEKQAVRMGDWKAVRPEGEDGGLELYNLRMMSRRNTICPSDVRMLPPKSSRS